MSNVGKFGLVALGLIGGLGAAISWQTDNAEAQTALSGAWTIAVAREGQGVAWRLNTMTGYLEWCSPNTDTTGLRCFGAPPLAP